VAVAVSVVVVSEGGSSVEATEEEVVTKVEAATKEEVATTAEGALVEVVEGATVGLEVALMIEAIVGMVEAVVDKTRTILILVVDNQEGGHIKVVHGLIFSSELSL